MKPIITVVGALAIFAGAAQATDYFVGKNGSDEAPGTSPSEAWESLSRLTEAGLKAGDRVFLQGGTQFNGRLFFIGDGRVELGGPVITLGSYGEGRATIFSCGETALRFENMGNVVVENLIVRGAGVTDRETAGVHFINTLPGAVKLPGITIRNVEASGHGRAGILIEGAASDGSRSGFAEVEINGCLAHGNTRTGIETTGVYQSEVPGFCHERVWIRDCETHSNPGDPDMITHSGSGIIMADVSGGLIEDCESWGNGAECRSALGGPVGIWTVVSHGVVIRRCWSHGNRTRTLDGGGFDLDIGVTGSLIEDCFSNDNDGPGYLLYTTAGAPREFSDNAIRNCVSRDDGRRNDYGGIYIGHHGSELGVRGILIENCRVHIVANGIPHRAAITVFGAQDVRFIGNEITTTGGVWFTNIGSDSSVRLEGNKYLTTDGQWQLCWDGNLYNSLPEWQTATGQEAAVQF